MSGQRARHGQLEHEPAPTKATIGAPIGGGSIGMGLQSEAPKNSRTGSVMSFPITYIKDFAADIPFEAMDQAITWTDYGAPRSEAYYADRPVPYTYGAAAYARTYHPHTQWSDTLSAVRDRVQAHCGQAFELLFCNRYAHGNQHLGWHADDSDSVDDARPIPVISFGSEREIWFRENGKSDVHKILLAHGSLLLMHAGMQDTHQHRIPKAGRIVTPRVSLTFRGLSPATDVAAARAKAIGS
jgi:alkylated DNA repair dioxygenase AlkB